MRLRDTHIQDDPERNWMTMILRALPESQRERAANKTCSFSSWLSGWSSPLLIPFMLQSKQAPLSLCFYHTRFYPFFFPWWPTYLGRFPLSPLFSQRISRTVPPLTLWLETPPPLKKANFERMKKVEQQMGQQLSYRKRKKEEDQTLIAAISNQPLAVLATTRQLALHTHHTLSENPYGLGVG